MKLFRVIFYTRAFFPSDQIKAIELYAANKGAAEDKAMSMNLGTIILTKEL